MWISRMRQFWDVDRTIRIMGDDYEPSYMDVNKDMVDGDWDIVVSAGSTMPVNKAARMQQLVQLAQTPAEDGLPVVDRQTMLESSELPDVKAILERFEQIKQAQQQAQMEEQQAEERRTAQQMQYESMMEQIKMKNQNALQQQNTGLQSNQAKEMQQMKHQEALEMEQMKQAQQMQEQQMAQESEEH